MIRQDGRSADQLREITFDLNYTRWAEGSVLVRFGHTHVLCNVTVENTLPGWLKYSPNPHGWVTAEYAMLPRSTQQRVRREQRWPKGRTQEISRLIGRSLRMGLDLSALGERTLTVDCDVLQADGGTRTAAISGGWLAVALALRPLIAEQQIPPHVMRHQITAVSVGIVDGALLLDLPYAEDSTADADVNVVMADGKTFVEVQGTAESAPIPPDKFTQLLTLAQSGIQTLSQLQQTALA